MTDDLQQAPHSDHESDASDAPLSAIHDVALLDLDGVVYVGPDAVPHAPEALQAAARAGMRFGYVTNNAARPPSVVGDHLRRIGIPCTDDEVVTSAQAAARAVAGLVPDGSKVLVVGGAGLVEALGEHGLVATFSAEDEPAAVIQGFSPDVGWPLLAEGAYALATGLPWVASNLDTTVPTSRGRAPGNGTLVAALASATGREPLVTGKPERPLFDEAVVRTSARRALVVGDRLDTDIEGAVNADLDSLLVMTGISDPIDAVRAPAGMRPTYVGRDLRALTLPPSRARREGDVWRSGRWAALVEASRLLVVPVPGQDGAGQDGAGRDGAGQDGAGRDGAGQDGAGRSSNGDAPGTDDASDALTAACAAGWAYEGEITGIDGLPDVFG